MIIDDGDFVKLIQIMGEIVHSGKMRGTHDLCYFFDLDNPPAKMQRFHERFNDL